MEIAFSILAILLALPALFLSLYCVVCLKARDLANEIADQDRSYSRDPVGARALNSDHHELGPGMYDLDGIDEDSNDFLEDSGI